MLFELAAGILVYRVSESGWRSSRIGSFFAVSLFTVGVVIPNGTPLVLAMIPLIILAAVEEGSPVQQFASYKWVLFLGEISFSIYLTHWIIIQVVNRLYVLPEVTIPGIAGRILLTWFVVLSVAYISYVAIEVPSRRWSRSGGGRRFSS